jgi:hypothetical protein
VVKCFALMLGSTLVSVSVVISSVGQYIYEVNGSVLDNKMDEVIVYVDVFRSSMVRPVTGECDSSLRVGIKWDWVCEGLKNFPDEAMKP